ncbi:MAG: 2-oxoacid:acceptor oxidoreductase family protein [Pseudomonadota bacterium]
MADTKQINATTTEVIITGFGGQGIILAGRIIGKAAALGDGKESTLVQSYGPESRGGACSAQVVISDRSIHYPYIRQPDILVCMSQSGYEKYIDHMKDNTLLLVDEDLVHPEKSNNDPFPIPATRMAEELGRKMMANIIMTGFFTAITQKISLKAAEDTVAESVPKGTEEANIKAFKKGYDFGLALLKGREKKAAGKIGAIA